MATLQMEKPNISMTHKKSYQYKKSGGIVQSNKKCTKHIKHKAHTQTDRGKPLLEY